MPFPLRSTFAAVAFAALSVAPVRAESAESTPPAAAPPPAAPVTGQGAPKPEAWGEDRVMDNHRFPFPQFVPSSFVVNSFAVRAGVEYRSVPNFPTDRSTGALTAKKIDLSIISATQGADASVRVHRLFALTFNGYGRARVGTNSATLLGEGVDFTAGADGGGLVRLFRSRVLQVSLRAQAGYHAGQHAGIAQFYQSVRGIAEQTAMRVLNGNTDIAAERARIDAAFSEAARGLVSSSTGWRVSSMLTAAWAFSSFAGLQAMVGFTFDRTTERSRVFQLGTDMNVQLEQVTAQRQMMAGFALDVGGASRGIPIDLVAEYSLLPLFSDTSGGGVDANQTTIEHRLALGCYYSGRTDLQLGLSAYTLLAQLREFGAEGQASDKARDAGGLFVFRYIW